mmetsp:Transcript_23531/g.42446  ORF Transcript_23531/g.42446 Transcript_23531/m.42446 type:complete len:228 (-) Transcript_23531:22-705(-)
MRVNLSCGFSGELYAFEFATEDVVSIAALTRAIHEFSMQMQSLAGEFTNKGSLSANALERILKIKEETARALKPSSPPRPPQKLPDLEPNKQDRSACATPPKDMFDDGYDSMLSAADLADSAAYRAGKGRGRRMGPGLTPRAPPLAPSSPDSLPSSISNGFSKFDPADASSTRPYAPPSHRKTSGSSSSSNYARPQIPKATAASDSPDDGESSSPSWRRNRLAAGSQ